MKVMKGIEMTQSLKKLALSFVIATSVTATSFADGSRIFDLEGSGIFQNSTHFEVSRIFDNPAPRKLDDSFNLEKIAQSKIVFNNDQNETDSLLGEKTKSSVEATPSLENELFSLPEDTAEEMAKRMQEAEDRKRAEKLANDNAVAQEMTAQLIAGLNAQRAAAEGPSTLRVVGGYAYSAGATVFNVVDWAAHNSAIGWVGSFAFTYRFGEELVANAAGLVAATSMLVGTGNPLAAGAAWNVTATGVRFAAIGTRYAFPWIDGLVAGFVADKVQTVVVASFDAAKVVVPAIANTALSGAKIAASGASYLASGVSYAAPVVADAAYSAASTAYSATSSAVSFIRSFWG